MTYATEQRSGRTPRVALMGEFSAGKSTLANLLLGQAVSPVMATATQLPPIWYRAGTGSHYLNGVGERVDFDFDGLDALDTSDVQVIFHHLEARILSLVEIVDFPGTSDPNMQYKAWPALLERMDMVLWCTPAHQAWRQSEAALWEEMSPKHKLRSALLVTRMDQVHSEIERKKLVGRLDFEAGQDFGTILPVSLVGQTETHDAQQGGLSEIVRLLQGWCQEIATETPRVESRPLNLISEAPAPVRGHTRPLRPLQPGTITPRRVVPTRSILGGRNHA